MVPEHPHVLVLSELFPAVSRPTFGIFVERQTTHTAVTHDMTVVVPTRVVPPLRIWREWARPRQAAAAWHEWRRTLGRIPLRDERCGYDVHYPRYSAPPRQLLHALDGFFAYAALRPLLQRLHRERPFALMHAHYATPAGTAALLARRWMNVPVVISIHGLDLHYTARQNRIGRRITGWALRQADLVLANSTWTADRIRTLAEPRRLEVVRLGGDLQPPAAALPINRPSAGLTILTAGYLEPHKGHAVMLQALRLLIDEGHKLHYRIVGDGPLRAALEQQSRQLGLTAHVAFAGARRHDEMAAEYAACDIFALPSTAEAFGLVYIEALSMGKPVLGCVTTGGPQDLAALGDCIELVRPHDHIDLAAGLRRLIGDPQRRAAMAATGQRIVAEHFTWAGCAQRTGTLYRELITVPGVTA